MIGPNQANHEFPIRFGPFVSVGCHSFNPEDSSTKKPCEWHVLLQFLTSLSSINTAPPTNIITIVFRLPIPTALIQ
jgi:hypothetical protein